jgi:hypothetical protein
MQNKKPAVKMTTGLRQSEKWAHETQGWCISASNAVVLTALSVLYASIIPWPHRITDLFQVFIPDGCRTSCVPQRSKIKKA